MPKSMLPENLKKTKSVRRTTGLLIAVIAIGSVIGGWYYYSINKDKHEVVFDDVAVEVELARSQQERTQGLSGRDKLDNKTGMLFIFDESDTHGFHMKDMNFAIDIIWMDENGKVVDTTPYLSPDTYPETFRPSDPVRYALEVPAGFSQDHGIKVGDKARLEY